MALRKRGRTSDVGCPECLDFGSIKDNQISFKGALRPFSQGRRCWQGPVTVAEGGQGPVTLIICRAQQWGTEPGSTKWQIYGDRKPKREMEPLRGFMWPRTGPVAWTEDPGEKIGLLGGGGATE